MNVSTSKIRQAIKEWNGIPLEISVFPEIFVHDRYYTLETALNLGEQIKNNLQCRWHKLVKVSVDSSRDGWNRDFFFQRPSIVAWVDKLPVPEQWDHPLFSLFVPEPNYRLPNEEREIQMAAKQLGVPYKPVTGLSTFQFHTTEPTANAEVMA